MFPGKLTQSQARRLAAAMIVFIFLFLFLMIIIPATTIPHYYGTLVEKTQIGSEYAYFWLAAAVSLVLYGIIVVDWLREATAERDRRRLPYTIEIFPISLVRFLQWSPKTHVRHGVIVAADILFAASGTINVLLWLLTRPPIRKGIVMRESYQMGMLAPVAQETQAPTEAVATAGPGSRVSHPSFPDVVLMARAGVYVPEPYEWAPPREGELRP
ncbi:hypothetical protein BS47DRAFT_1346742 [Hydnum rufescens UP504]|uniref:Uncharacterized protein n=1 Tax=Hydnum rufescens UP504 TaxID=1448309 RepID=A0A9P6AU09_9AGAM|nr:hypothetical protein BS47DRAFT_1346742 [Hydnum rufescens UP504]